MILGVRLIASVLFSALWLSAGSAAESPARQVAARACDSLLARVNATPGTEPLFLQSYDSSADVSSESGPTLPGAYTYDNALAVIALVACGHRDAALRVADALLAASERDRSGATGRIRNAYRPGPITERPVLPMGWWSDQEGRWAEDPYQVGTATGNVAWAALALLTMAEQTQDDRYRAAAARLARWAVNTTLDPRRPAGFDGGIYGYDDTPERLTWKSTEHNTDLAAVFEWLARLEPGGYWQRNAETARAFVAAQWDQASGHFWVGTTPDGVTPNRGNAGLDAQLWPPLLSDAPEAWSASMRYVEQHHAVSGGFDFNDDRDGIWWEGTAQAALTYRALGQTQEADRLLSKLNGQFSPDGFIWASSKVRLTTGLGLSPASTFDDFYYYRLPHLAPTAWTALAAIGWNPFTGARVDARR
ncbi:hypothetical protein [Dongia deserti]|uniref:hypothetical protein n=1 Tax=Dongia deserti TaxID=2268030 RepID=UPI000E65E432|nr:hypothetical protein [Dongia deserti]